LYEIPVISKGHLAPCFFGSGFFQIGYLQESLKTVGIAVFGFAFVGKVVPLGHFGDAGLEGKFDGITPQIVRSVVHA
jgi:hypothetical protein